MGQSSSKRYQKKKVLIVGGSFAGLELLQKLWNYLDVTLIDKNEYFEYTSIIPRALIQQNFYDQLNISYKYLVKIWASNKFQFIQGNLLSVQCNKIEVYNIQENQNELINFDYLVLCTGASYSQPIRNEKINILQDRMNNIKEYQQEISKANSILVIGGGAVGVEMLGELKHFYPNKRIGVVQDTSTLLPYLPAKAQIIVNEWAQKNNIELHLNKKFSKQFQEQYKYDLAINSTGYKFNTQFMQKNMMQCVSRNGQIFVNDYLQMTNQNPLMTLQSQVTIETYSNIYALGDVNLSKINEEKSILPIKISAEICANNILCQANNHKSLKKLPKQFPCIYIISLGPNLGISIFNQFVQVSKQASEQKTQIFETYMKALKGNNKAQKESEQYMDDLKQKLCYYNTFCCCCPCSRKPDQATRKN